MIADVSFGSPVRGVRPMRFVPRASIPVDLACAVANRLRDVLQELFGAACELAIGEPAAVAPAMWPRLAQDAMLFLCRGRPTDVVLVVPHRDARRLVLRAFGEAEDLATADDAAAPWSALERHAIGRIGARCAAALEPLSEPREPCRSITAREAPPCVAYFDVRVHTPISVTVGLGIVRDLPLPGPSGSLDPAILADVAVNAGAVFAEGTISMASLVALRAGDVLKLDTKVGSPASLTAGGRHVARGVAGVAASHTAFLVHDVALGAHP